jgi:hypothetical protein
MEGAHLQFRTELFNALNKTNFMAADATAPIRRWNDHEHIRGASDSGRSEVNF